MNAKLHHEAGDGAEESRVIIETVLHQVVEAVGAERRPGAVHLENERPLARLDAHAKDLRRRRASTRTGSSS